jgi:hypothetical protein
LSEKAAPPASAALKVVHTLVFFGFTALAVAAAWSELSQLGFALSRPFHSGSPPFWPALLGAALSAGGAAALALRLLQKREVTLFVSLSILLGFFVSLSVNASSPSQRSIEAANVAVLELAREAQREMGKTLQKTAAVPTAPDEWNAVLALAEKKNADAPLSIRDRSFRLLAPRVALISEEAWQGQGAAPGTLGIWISSDRAQFTITPVGLSNAGKPQVLLDDQGKPIRLRGVFNPDTL